MDTKDNFASHPKAKFWSINNKLKPENVAKYSIYKAEFLCDKCNHYFTTKVKAVVNNNTWCPYCGNNKLCDDLNCNFCFERSFASNPVSKFWSPNNKIKSPRFISKGSNSRILLKCKTCGVDSDKIIKHLQSENLRCKNCKDSKKTIKRKRVKKNQHINILSLNKSFFIHPKSKFIVNDDPIKINKYSFEKYNFKCETCNHIFDESIRNITMKKNGVLIVLIINYVKIMIVNHVIINHLPLTLSLNIYLELTQELFLKAPV